MAALSRFISKLGEKALPLYRLMKKADKFEWTEEAEAAFIDHKRTLMQQDESPNGSLRWGHSG